MKNKKPTESELEILEVLWNKGPCTVKMVNEQQNKSKEVGYTTTLKIMQIMHEKGLLTREKEGRSHLYKAAISEKETRNALLNRFVEKTFGGSSSRLVMQALGNNKTSKKELEEIEDYLKKLKQQKS
jgi:predicted transcriptional regulator